MEIGKVYLMKRANHDAVRIESLDSKGGAMVTYIGREHLGRCPVYVDQLTSTPIDSFTVFEYWFDVKVEKLRILLNKQMRELQ